jgi:hypothetical protein
MVFPVSKHNKNKNSVDVLPLVDYCFVSKKRKSLFLKIIFNLEKGERRVATETSIYFLFFRKNKLLTMRKSNRWKRFERKKDD